MPPDAPCRDEIAECSERAYATLSVADARKLMLLSSDQETLAYAEEVSCSPYPATMRHKPPLAPCTCQHGC